MGLFSKQRPKIKIQTTKKDGFSGWLKCSSCLELIHTKELDDNNKCCPKCDYHYRLPAPVRVKMLSDKDSFKELFNNLKSVDTLNFVDSRPYVERLEKSEKQAYYNEAIVTGTCTIDKAPIVLGVMDFSFMAGSMGSVVGERLTNLIELAIELKLPVVIVCASGGARMQESILSLMQMAKVSAALEKLHVAQLPYITILTNPTTGGITASFASLGDIIIAEPKALICFAGPRVIEQTIGQKLPEGAQKSEFLLEHGMIDLIIHRSKLKTKLSQIIKILQNR